MFSKILCFLGIHDYNDKFVGLLYRECESCKKQIQVATPETYRPTLGRKEKLIASAVHKTLRKKGSSKAAKSKRGSALSQR